MKKGFQRFPDFGSELKRKHAVHKTCYGCATFYDGCKAWPEAKEFRCSKYDRLPDVLPGHHRQEFPDPCDRTGEKTQAPEPPDRRCECGEPLPKGRQYCDECRREHRRETKRGYMRNYMQGRRAG